MKPLIVSVFAIFLALPASAATVAKKCPDLVSCAKAVSELTGQHYLFDADVRGVVFSTSSLELTKENAELIFTNLLHLQNFTRVPSGQPGTYLIMTTRHARDSAIPLVRASKTEKPVLPNSWDMMTLSYKASNPSMVDHIARQSRSFMPAASRIIPSEPSGTLLVTDSALNLGKLYELIRDEDVTPSPELRKSMAARQKSAAAARASSPKNNTSETPASLSQEL